MAFIDAGERRASQKVLPEFSFCNCSIYDKTQSVILHFIAPGLSVAV